MITRTNKKGKAAGLETKGDKAAEKGKFEKALKAYREARDLDPDNPVLYDKLIDTHQKTKDQWDDSDFAESLLWTMKRQELANPRLKRVHAQLEPDWRDMVKTIREMMQTTDEKVETDLVEKIASFSGRAVYPLVEVLLSFKKLMKGSTPP